jgi:hypothetical protein
MWHYAALVAAFGVTVAFASGGGAIAATAAVCGPEVRGTVGGDRLGGGTGPDLLRGRDGADRVNGFGASDCLFGGSGSDELRGGKGSDELRGGHGDDLVYARDGQRDVVRCGIGDDKAVVDSVDLLREGHGCERARGADLAVSGPGPPSDPRWNLFSSASPWNTRIDRSDLAPNSDVMISKLVADGDPSTITPQLRQNWGTPMYFARPSDPLYTIDTTHNDPDSRAQDGRQVRVPAGAQPSQESDGVMWIVDQESGWVNQVQRAVPDHSTRVISAWKSYRFRYDGNGFPETVTAAPTGIQPIRPEELAAGYVNHAISMGARCLSGHPVAPFDQSLTIGKTCAGDSNPASTRLSMGNVVFLDMSHAQIEALGVPIWQEAILKGLADYGAVVGLNGGSAWSFKFENPIGRTSLGKADPYQAAGLPSTLDFSDALDKVGGWEAKLKVLEPFERPCFVIC